MHWWPCVFKVRCLALSSQFWSIKNEQGQYSAILTKHLFYTGFIIRPKRMFFFYGNKMENSKWTRWAYLASLHSPWLATQKTEFASLQPCNDNECCSFSLLPCQDHGCLLLAQCVQANIFQATFDCSRVHTES